MQQAELDYLVAFARRPRRRWPRTTSACRSERLGSASLRRARQRRPSARSSDEAPPPCATRRSRAPPRRDASAMRRDRRRPGSPASSPATPSAATRVHSPSTSRSGKAVLGVGGGVRGDVRRDQRQRVLVAEQLDRVVGYRRAAPRPWFCRRRRSPAIAEPRISSRTASRRIARSASRYGAAGFSGRAVRDIVAIVHAFAFRCERRRPVSMQAREHSPKGRFRIVASTAAAASPNVSPSLAGRGSRCAGRRSRPETTLPPGG